MELWVKINGCLLRFGIGEFAVITGLKCVEEDATFYDKPVVNRLLKEYFPRDGKKAITRDANNHGINKDDFDIIESGQYQTLGGLPLALQIWFFECYSMVDKHLAVRTGTNVPCILNWKVTETLTYADLTGEVIMSSIDKLNYRNIFPTREEMSTLNIDTHFEVNAADVASGEVPAFHIDDSIAASPPCPQNMEQQSKRPHPQNTEQLSKRPFPQNMDRQPNPSYDPLVRIDLLNAEVEKLRCAIGKLTDTVTTLNNYVVSSFEKVFSFLNIKETKETREDVTDSKIRQRVSDDNTSGLDKFDGYQYNVVPDFVDQVNQDNVLADEGVNDGVDHGDVKGDTFWDDIGDEDLAMLQMSQIVLHKPSIIDIEDDYISPEQSVRQKLPGKYAKSPYFPVYDSGASGSAYKIIFDIKHPFTIKIDDFDPLSPLAKEFCAFVDNEMDTSAKNIYTDEVNKLVEAFTFGSCHATTKDWFHSLAYCGRSLIDTHLDVLFYYLRKRGKYGPNVAMRFTTTDFAFGNKINSLYKDFKVNQDPSVIPEGHEIEECIHIYDSNHGAINDILALDAVLPYAILIPYFLKSSDFYVEKKGIDWNNGAYTDKSHSDALQINLVNNVPQQIKCDCGAFVAGFAEYFILSKEIRKDNFDIETLRTSKKSNTGQVLAAGSSKPPKYADMEVHPFEIFRNCMFPLQGTLCFTLPLQT
ncbi:uncharacterized protein [Nicotiana sylvestris]|uniref:uncharacterized protein n=1 Tax=Nicotiana sylvestris TaxID=4096 RepID=UPI00388C34EB